MDPVLVVQSGRAEAVRGEVHQLAGAAALDAARPPLQHRRVPRAQRRAESQSADL